MVGADNFQPYGTRGVKRGQRFKSRVGDVDMGSDTKLPVRPSELHARIMFAGLYMYFGEVGDVPEVIEGLGEVRDYAVERACYPFCQLRPYWDQ